MRIRTIVLFSVLIANFVVVLGLILLLVFSENSSSTIYPTTLGKSVDSRRGEYTGDLEFIVDEESPSGLEVESDGACVFLNTSILWEEGNTLKALVDYLRAHTELFIDGVSKPRIDKWKDTATSNLWICFSMDGVEKGLHDAELRTSTMSGREQSYSWTFYVR